MYREQRERYHKIRNEAKDNPSILSIIVDGMDQNKTNLPHFHRKNKSAASLSFLKTHITGSLIHDYGGVGHIDLLQWPHDSNLMLTVMLDAIIRRLRQRSYFPSKLFVQLDNTCRENKNQYVLCFFAAMVQLGLFEEIQVGFVMVAWAHT